MLPVNLYLSPERIYFWLDGECVYINTSEPINFCIPSTGDRLYLETGDGDATLQVEGVRWYKGEVNIDLVQLIS